MATDGTEKRGAPGARRRTLAAALPGLVLALLTFVSVRAPLSGPVRLELGGFDRPFAGGDWPRAVRADVRAEDAGGDATSLYAREAPGQARFDLPLEARGTLQAEFRATARIRSGITVFTNGSRLGDVVVPRGRWDGAPGPWARYVVAGPSGGAVGIGIATEARPLVRRADEELARPELLLDFVEVQASEGLRLSPAAAAVAAAAPAALAVLLAAAGAPAGLAGLAASLLALLSVVAHRLDPLAAAAAAPRLLPAALAAGAVTALLLGLQPRALVDRRQRSGLTALVAAGVVAHGAVVFFPNHNPPDIDIHARRTFDLAAVPLEYGALLRYGSHLPTTSQDIGAATAALGEGTLIPYSPLPYVAYYVLHAMGLDLYWAMTVANAVLAMLVAPLLWLAARRVFDVPAAWMATLLYTLDLAVWHHLGRSHAPAVFGAALGTAAILHLLFHVELLRRPADIALAAGALAAAVLGYSSLVVLLGLFGLALLALIAADARDVDPAVRRGMALALLGGGLLAGLLFYFHYVPGLLRGAAGVEAEPDLFPGRTFLIFHNESRQSLRLWALGLWIPLGAGLACLPAAWRRARASARPILLAWVAAWALVMLLKEPWLFPKLLRWAKEDQFLSPACALFLGAAIAGIQRRPLRLLAAGVALLVAVWLQVRDFAHHADSLRL